MSELLFLLNMKKNHKNISYNRKIWKGKKAMRKNTLSKSDNNQLFNKT